MNFHFLSKILITCALFTLGWANESQAYIDPGTGSIIAQAIVAAVVGGLVLIKTYWRKLKMVFSRKKDGLPIAENSEDND